METRHLLVGLAEPSGSYPTYEEWKRLKRISLCSTTTCSYPTYEEWKLVISIPCSTFISSYPTYEEWKQNTSIALRSSCISFLSYL